MRHRRQATEVDLSTSVASVRFPTAVMTASGTAGHGAELGTYFDLSAIGAVVVKSLSADPWPGNRSPRVCAVPGGMLNAVGLQGPGVAAWLIDELPALEAAGAVPIRGVGRVSEPGTVIVEEPEPLATGVKAIEPVALGLV